MKKSNEKTLISDLEQRQIFASNLNYYLSLYNKTQKEVADSIDVSPQTFNTWCQGKALPRMKKLRLLADYFQIRKSALIDPPPTRQDLPEEIRNCRNLFSFPDSILSVLEPIAEDEPDSAAADIYDMHADLIFCVSDDSMMNDGIRRGDLVFIRRQNDIDEGEKALVVIDNQVMIRRIHSYSEQAKMVLQSASPDYDDFILEGDRMKSCQILGKVVAYLRMI